MYLAVTEQLEDSEAEKGHYQMLQLIEALNEERTVKVFKMMEMEAVAIYPNPDIMNASLQKIRERFYGNVLEENGEHPLVSLGETKFPVTLIVTMSDGLLAKSVDALRGAVYMIR